MSAHTGLAHLLTAQPSVQYRRNEWFYFQYDGFYLAVFLALDAYLLATGAGPLVEWKWSYLWLLPLVFYVHVLLNVFVHNCCHGNFPRPINRLIGELAGVLVITRYASWEIIHQRHHRYSDDPEKDPHNVVPNFWRFLARTMLVNVERQLQNQAYDQFGDTPANRRREAVRSVLSFSVMIPLILAAYLLLGWQAFFFLYLPAQGLGWLVVAHFNWSTHNAHSKSGDFHPVNLNHGWYRLGNLIWFGLYFHANHHKRANIFNPMKMDAVLAKRAAKAAKVPEPVEV